jgi:hypothetical protein
MRGRCKARLSQSLPLGVWHCPVILFSIVRHHSIPARGNQPGQDMSRPVLARAGGAGRGRSPSRESTQDMPRWCSPKGQKAPRKKAGRQEGPFACPPTRPPASALPHLSAAGTLYLTAGRTAPRVRASTLRLPALSADNSSGTLVSAVSPWPSWPARSRAEQCWLQEALARSPPAKPQMGLGAFRHGACTSSSALGPSKQQGRCAAGHRTAEQPKAVSAGQRTQWQTVAIYFIASFHPTPDAPLTPLPQL